MLIFTALTSLVLEAARLERPRDPPAHHPVSRPPVPRPPEPKPFRLACNPVPLAVPANPPAVAPRLPFGRLLVEE